MKYVLRIIHRCFLDDKFYDGFSAFVCSQANAEMSGRKRADFYGWHRGEHDDLPDRLTPVIRAFTVFCRRDFDSACDDPCGFWKAAGQNVQKGICFLVYFCISDEWNPTAVPPVYGYDESVFCNCVSRICGAERNTKPVGKHSGRTEADLRGTSDTE